MDHTRLFQCWLGCAALVAFAFFGCTSGDAGDAPTPNDPQVSASSDAGLDANDGGVNAGYPAAHPAPPQIQKGTDGGTVLTSPRIVPIAFSGDPFLSTITSFTSAIGSSAYWNATVSEYGVGPATATAPIVVDPSELALADGGAAATSNAATQAFLASHLDGAHAGWGTPDSATIYALFLPPNVTTDDGDTSRVSCTDFTGYHFAMTVNGTRIAYVVIPRCASLTGWVGVTGVDALTGALSHELVEAATDPFSTLNQLTALRDVGYAKADEDHAVFNLNPGGEVGDMCSISSDSFFKPAELGFVVQRIWSNASAAAGRPPCQPVPPGVIDYGMAPVLTDNVTITSDIFGAKGTTKGVSVPLGQSVTIALALYSSAPMSAPFNVQAFDLAAGAPDLDIVLDHDTGVNGDTIHATITRLKNGAYGGTGVVFIAYTTDDDFRDWMGFVAN